MTEGENTCCFHVSIPVFLLYYVCKGNNEVFFCAIFILLYLILFNFKCARGNKKIEADKHKPTYRDRNTLPNTTKVVK